jgi:hypothetical protein
MSGATSSAQGDGFADVLNGLALGGRRKRKEPTPSASGEETVESGQEIVDRANWSWTIPSSAPVVTPAFAPVTEEELGDAAIVRPYAWTGGRTKSTVDFQIETLVSTSEHGENVEALTQPEHRTIAELCAEPRSVAEIATMLSVPLGVAKVLLGDMANLGLVIVHKTAVDGGNKAHLTLMERVLSGLRRL